jgi:excisionase family DNA binding protein
MPSEPVVPPAVYLPHRLSPLMEVYEVAHDLKLSHEEVLRRIRRGDIPAVKLGKRSWRVLRVGLEAYLHALHKGNGNGNGHGA